MHTFELSAAETRQKLSFKVEAQISKKVGRGGGSTVVNGTKGRQNPGLNLSLESYMAF